MKRSGTRPFETPGSDFVRTGRGGKYLGDATTAGTIPDHLIQRSHLREFEGKSYRLKEAATWLEQNTAIN